MNTFEDKIIVCSDCSSEFEWSSGEQEFMFGLKTDGKLDRTDRDGNHVQGEVTPPKRCIVCRANRKSKYPQK